MKKLVVLLTLVATAAAYSQGVVNFVTRNTTAGAIVGAKIGYGPGGPVTEGTFPSWSGGANYVQDGGYTFGGPNARAALYAVNGTTTDAATLRIITPNVPFRSGATAGFVYSQYPNDTGNSTREVPGNTAGTAATFQIRAWDTGLPVAADTMNFEEAMTIMTANGKGYFGVGNVFTINTGGGSLPPAYLSYGATTAALPFNLAWVPEPSIIGLGILGAVAGMVVFRRRQ